MRKHQRVAGTSRRRRRRRLLLLNLLMQNGDILLVVLGPMNQNTVESTCHKTEGSNLFLRRRRRESSRFVSFRLVVKVSTAICWAESSCWRSGLGVVLGGGGALAIAKVIAKKKQNQTKPKDSRNPSTSTHTINSETQGSRVAGTVQG